MLGRYYNGLGAVDVSVHPEPKTREEAISLLKERGIDNPSDQQIMEERYRHMYDVTSVDTPINRESIPTGKSFFEKHKLKLIGGAALAGLAFFMFRR